MKRLKYRNSCYCMQPSVYEIKCDKCGGENITWSEYKHKIWCFDCEIDTEGTGGIFDGPIPMNLAEMMGISFDRIRIKDGKRLAIKNNGGHIYWQLI